MRADRHLLLCMQSGIEPMSVEVCIHVTRIHWLGWICQFVLAHFEYK